MEFKVTPELEYYIEKDNTLFYAMKYNSESFQSYFQNQYKYLLGKQVKVFGNKAWNVGTITELLPRIGHNDGNFYLRLMVKGPDNKVLMFDYEEIVEFIDGSTY